MNDLYQIMKRDFNPSNATYVRRLSARTSSKMYVASQEELDQNVQENLITKSNTLFACNLCETKPQGRYNITRHIETHYEGLLYPCERCSKVCGNREALRIHNYRCQIKHESLQLV